jgi:copper chaperone
MATKVVTFNVGMSCEGCSGAIKRILSKIEGVRTIDANIESKTVIVTCSTDIEDEVLNASLMKWSNSSGKSVELVGSTIFEETTADIEDSEVTK